MHKIDWEAAVVRLSADDLMGRSVLVVEYDTFVLAMVLSAINAAGGMVVGVVPMIDAALEVARDSAVDVLMLNVEYVGDSACPIPQLFERYGIEVQFYVGFDEWYESDEVLIDNVREMQQLLLN